MKSILIIYASNHGHSGKIAERIASMLRGSDLEATVHEVENHDSTDPSSFDAVIVMASIRAGRHQAKMAKWVKANAGLLNGLPTAFVSVSLSNGSDAPEAVEVNREQAENFAETAGWEPDLIELVAGCLQYPAYNFLTRFLMKRMAKSNGLPLDTSREHEYTDWAALESFAERFADPDRPAGPA